MQRSLVNNECCCLLPRDSITNEIRTKILGVCGSRTVFNTDMDATRFSRFPCYGGVRITEAERFVRISYELNF